MDLMSGLSVVHTGTKGVAEGCDAQISYMDEVEVSGIQYGSSCEKTSQENDESCPKSLGQIHRVLRKRSRPSIVISIPKRRFPLTPKKLVASKDDKTSESFYFGGKLTLVHNKALETIYEEPVTTRDGTVKYSGAAKLRRLNFNSIAKAKVKKRKIKIKKVLGGKMLKKKRMSMEEFIAKLRGIATTSETEEMATLLTSCVIK